MIELLLAAGSLAVDQTDRNGHSPLFAAACYGHSRTIAALLAAGSASLDAPDMYGGTPLWAAVANANGYKETVSLLIAAGSTAINRQNDIGQSPLHCAVQKGLPEIVELLLFAGARRDLLFEGKSPLEWATANKDQTIIDLFKQQTPEDQVANITADLDRARTMLLEYKARADTLSFPSSWPTPSAVVSEKVTATLAIPPPAPLGLLSPTTSPLPLATSPNQDVAKLCRLLAEARESIRDQEQALRVAVSEKKALTEQLEQVTRERDTLLEQITTSAIETFVFGPSPDDP